MALSNRLFLVFVLMFSVPAVAVAQQNQLPAVQFGLVGLARGETARLNVVNTLPPSPVRSESSCHVSLRFLNERGESFRDAAGEADLEPGHATQLDLPAATAFENSTALRRLIRASVESNPGPPDLPPNPCAGIVSTMELFDNLTGRLVSLYQNPGPPEVSPGPPETNPGPPDVYGMLGLARLQAAVLNVINLTPETPNGDPIACGVTLTFLDSAGQMFPAGRTGEWLQRHVALEPGEFASLTLPASLVFAGSRDLRQAFRASVEINPGPPELPPGPCAGIVSTLELVDTLTGRTQVVYSAGVQPGPSQ